MLRLDLSELAVCALPNIDFIGTVESNRDNVEYKTYPIEVPRQFFVLLMAMVIDDEKSILQMQRAFEERYPIVSRSLIDENFLAPQKLDGRYVTPATVPNFITKEEYLAGAKKLEAQIRQQIKSIEDSGKQLRFPVEVYVEDRLRRYRRFLKDQFFSQFIRFQAAYGYGQTLEKFRIKDRLNREVRMFSTDTIGWTTYNYVINHDITIQLDSNFGYGRSSYFLLSLMYKGIEIYPFSAYVRYPYANMRTLIAHTRTYRVERDSWSDALIFVAETANAAITSPQNFVDTFITGEIAKMMDGLRKIIRVNVFREYVEEQGGNSRPQYLGVSTKGVRSFDFVAAPGEMLLARKAERIIGALAVLEKLKALDVIVADVDKSVRELLDMIKAIVPELRKGIADVRNDIRICEEEAGVVEALLCTARREVGIHENALCKLHDDILSKQPVGAPKWRTQSILDRTRREYELHHPEYGRAVKIQDRVDKEVEALKRHVDARNVFLQELKKCYGVGIKGERFWTVIEQLYPHEIQIENEVRKQRDKLSGKNTVRGIDGIRDSVRMKYRAEHQEVDDLFKEREEVLEQINTFTHSNLGK